MEIRTATQWDLPRIMDLGKEFGHLMLYQKDQEVMRLYLSRILVAEEETRDPNYPESRIYRTEIVGYYHYIVSGDPGFEEMLRCYRHFPEDLVGEASGRYSLPSERHQLCICMQGGSHREVFTEFMKYLQERYLEVWCYCSIKSRRPETYEKLGFKFDPAEQWTFFNTNKGDYSTYRLGRWRKV